MTEKEQFESLLNLLALTVSLGQSGVLTNTEAREESKTIYAELKKVLRI